MAILVTWPVHSVSFVFQCLDSVILFSVLCFCFVFCVYVFGFRIVFSILCFRFGFSVSVSHFVILFSGFVFLFCIL